MKNKTRLFQKGSERRIIALAMTACMVLTMSPPISAAEASYRDSGEIVLLSGFAALADEVREQNAALGVSLAALALPDTLEAYAAAADGVSPPVANGPEKPVPPTEPSEPSRPQDSGTPPESEKPESAPPEDSTPPESEKPESTPPESSSATESAPAEPPSKSSEPAASEPEPASAEPAASEETPGADEPATQVLAAYVQGDIAQADGETAPADTVTVSGVTWESAPDFDGNVAGTYIFTAVLPSGYALAAGAAMPVITVIVAKAEQAAVDKVIAMIDALPSYAELTAEPPAEGTPEYAAWLAKTQQTLADIRAAKAAYDALSDEDKAKIDEARTAKLTELSELAEGMTGLMPMAAENFGSECTWEVTPEGVLIIATKNGTSGILPSVFSDTAQPWAGQKGNIKEVRVESGVKANANSQYLFDGLLNCTKIDLLELDITGVTNMNDMFSGCNVLASLDVSKFDTANVTNMHGMFNGCKVLTPLDVSKFNTANVTDMSGMFLGCSSLTTLDVSKFDTTKVTDMYNMFFGCSKVAALDVSKFDTTKVTNMLGMFNGCEILTTLDVSKFDTTEVTNMREMFTNCSALTSLNANSFNTAKVTNMKSMFSGCSSLTSLDLSNFNTEKVTSMHSLFSKCAALKTLNISSFDTKNVTLMESMFSGCKALTSLDMSKFDTTKVERMYGMFKDCSSLTTLNLSSFNTTIHDSMGSMFDGCIKLESLNISSFNTTNAKNMSRMFRNCSNLTSITFGDSFNTAEDTDMDNMFSGCSGLTSLDLSNFIFTNVTSMSSMFNRCNLGLNTDYYKTEMSGTKLYLYAQHSPADLNTDHGLDGTETNIVYKPYAITKSAANCTITTSSRFKATDYQDYFTKTAPLYTSGAPTYDSAKDYAQQGETVTVTLTPTSGYEIDTVTVKDTNNSDVTLSGAGSTRTFVMPAGDVTVTATFKSLGYPVTINVKKDGFTWDGGGKTFTLKDNNNNVVPDLNKVANGTYTVYEGSTNTTVTVTVNGAATSATVDYYTVTFYDGTTAYGTPAPQVVLKTNGRVTKPTDPTKTGYTFAGWKTADGGTTAFEFATAPITGVTSIYASWTANVYTVTLNGNGGTGTALSSYTYGVGATLPTGWTKTGYTFKGWYDNAGLTGSAVTAISATDTGNKTYYAKWADETKPTISVAAPPTDWQKENVNLSVTFADNVGVTKLYAKTDSGAYAEIGSFGTTPYTYAASTEGEHTYRFQAEDAAGNFTESSIVTVKLDKTAPVVDTANIEVENGSKNLWDWIIGKTSLIIKVPVSDATSGVGSVTYAATPGSGSPISGTAALKDGKYEIALGVEFAGTIKVTATDKAGNASGETSLTANSGKIIAEDTAPTITITKPSGENGSGWYSAAFDLTVTVEDDKDSAISGGIGSITWKDGASGTEHTVADLPGSAPVYKKTFTIPVSASGEHTYYVNATDNAGNHAAQQTITVKLDMQAPALTVNGGDMGASSLVLTVKPTFGGSGGKVTVNGGTDDVTGSYTVKAKGTYIFTATSTAGKTAAVTTNVHEITFASAGETDAASQIVANGGKATAPANPTKTGYVFSKWQKNGTDFNFANDTIIADTTLTAVWTLNAPTVSLAADNTEVTYNGGTAATLTATPSHTAQGTMTYTYEWYQNGTKVSGATAKTLELQTVADSGEYTVKVTASVGGLTSAQAKSSAVTVTIAKAPVSFTVSGNTHDYDGSPKKATVTQAAGETPDVSGKFTVSYKKDGGTVDNPTQMGIYNVFVKLTDQNFKHKKGDNAEVEVGTLKINGTPYPGTIIWPTAADITYGQTLADSALTGSMDADEGSFAWESPTAVPAVQNSGFTVIFTPKDTNYAPEDKVLSITVAKATPTLVLPTAAGITYGDTLAKSALSGGSASATYNGVANTDVPGGYAWTTLTTKPAVADSNSTEYGLTFTPGDTDNYNVVTTGKVKLTVAQREAALRWSGHTGLTYTGNPVAVTAAVSNLVDTDSCAVTVTDGAKTAAGAYTATATALANGNYKLPGTGLTQDYTIAKAPVSFTVSGNTHDYDGSPKRATVAQTAGETPSIAGSFKVSYKKDGNDIANPTDVDVYDVLAELTDQNFKHKNKADSETKIWVGLLTINGIEYPNADTMTWPTAAKVTYGQKLADSTLIGGDQAANGSYAWKDDAIIPTVTNGGYTVVFTPTDTNYAPVEHTVSITVAKATAALTLPTAAGITYGDTLAKSKLNGGSASATYNGVDKAVPGKYTWTAPATMPKVSDSNSTEYGLTFTPTDIANYNVVGTGKIKLAVAQKPVGLTWAGYTALVYSGAPVTVTATATGLVGSDACTVTVIDGAKTDAGTHTAKVTAVSNANYKLPTEAAQSYEIAKKPIKVLWSNMFPTYDGTAKTPTVTLDGVVNGEDCTVVSTGSAAAGNAGRYKVAAALQGARSGNYTMQNPNEILVIQSAPVSVSLSDYSYKYDGAAKYATVTASPDVPTTVTYKLAGNAVAAPTEEGIYDIIVELNGKNYRFADGSDGKARRMGALTIYKEKPPELYTITFDKGAEDAAGTAPTLPPSVRDTVHFLPNNSFLRAGHAFVGWKNGDTLCQPGERFSQPANNSTVFTAQWEAATYDIGGVVDQDGKPVANVRVVLMRGAEQVAETVTNQIGEYRFDSVLPGLYNLVASKPSPDGVGDIIMTIMVEVKAADVEQANITLPSGKTNSIVEVAPGTPKIIVGNLDQTFKNTEGSDYTPEDKEVVKKGGTVEIKFSAKEKQKDEIAADAEEITKEAGRAKIGLYLSLDVEKTVTQPTNPDAPDAEPSSDTTVIPETSVLLESVIPLPSDLQGKQSYTVYRVHGGTVDSLTTGADSGERIEISEDKTTLVLYARKYSTYAIAYTEKSGGGNGSGGSNNGDDNSGAFTPTGPEVVIPPVEAETSKPEAPRPEASQPDNPKADGTDKDNGGDSDKNNGTNNENGENERADGGSNDAQKDEIRDALEDAIKNLPDTLTEEQRQEYIDRLTAIADAAIAALDGTNEPGEAKRIAQQAQKDMKNIVTEALALADGTAKPFVLASALFALAAVLLAAFALLKRKNKRRGLFSAIFAALAVAAFLLTSGWSGFVLADWWTLAVAAFAIGAALGVFTWHVKDEKSEVSTK